MDLPILITLAVVCVIIGIVLDNLVRTLRGDKAENLGSQGGEEAASTRGAQSKPEATAAGDAQNSPGISQPALSRSASGDLQEVLRIWRRPVEAEAASGIRAEAACGIRRDLAVEVNGKIAHSSAELDPDQLDRLGSALQELSAWLGKSQREPDRKDGQTAVSPEGAGAAGGQPASGPAPDQHLAARLTQSFLLEEVARPAEAAAGKAKRPSLNPIEIVTNALRADLRKPAEIETKSLAAQVNDVLQEKLIGSPLEKRGIQLMDGPDQGLLVRIGMEKYSGVDEVPDAEIRELIHAAVEEWGQRTTPGK